MIRSRTQARGLNRTRDKEQKKQLPKIQSQTRLKTALEKKETLEPLKIRPQSNNKQTKRTLSTSGACKTVRCEATTALYTSKIKQLQKQSMLLDNELKKTQQEINQIRKVTMQTKRKQQFIQADKNEQQHKQPNKDNKQTQQVKYRKNININDAKTLTNEIRIMQNKIGALRKKIDQQVSKNNTSRNRIDAIRKQIKTYKNLHQTLEINYEKTNKEFNNLLEIARKLEEEISQKNILVNKIRVENMHKKGQIIKQYDNILRQLDKEVANNNKKHRQSTQSSRSNNFYMTEINHIPDLRQLPKIHRISMQSPRKKQRALTSQLATVQQNLQYLQNQFEYLKQHKGTKNVQELTKNFQNQYQLNFKEYKYINNEMMKNLVEAREEYEKAKQDRDQVIEEIGCRNSEVKIQEINQIQINIQYVKNQRNRIVQAHQQYEQLYGQLKTLVMEINQKIHMKQVEEILVEGGVTEGNLLKLLQIIKQKFYELKHYDDDSSRIQIYPVQHQENDLNIMLQNAKKQTNTQKLMKRQDFLKLRQTIKSNANTTNNSTRRQKSGSRHTFSRK